jgi:hypothetical protein
MKCRRHLSPVLSTTLVANVAEMLRWRSIALVFIDLMVALFLMGRPE